MISSIYDYIFVNSYGQKFHMKDFRGKVILVVNTATKCGFANQFTELEYLSQKYKSDLVVLGFPCDQFAGQEPVEDSNMASVCQLNFGVTFQLSQKIRVNGRGTDPLFKYLKNKSARTILGRQIKWNFTKFLISADGLEIYRFSPSTAPTKIEPEIINLINKLKIKQIP